MNFIAPPLVCGCLKLDDCSFAALRRGGAAARMNMTVSYSEAT